MNPKPCLIVLCGPPCSGKTTLAVELHKETGLPHLSIDSIIRRVLPDSSWTEADRDLAYRVLGLIVESFLAAGRGIIVDGTFARAPHLQDLEALATTCNATCCVVQCRIDVSLAVRRFQDRAGQHSALDLDEGRVEHLNRNYPYRIKGLVLDTSRPVDECLAEICRQIGVESV